MSVIKTMICSAGVPPLDPCRARPRPRSRPSSSTSRPPFSGIIFSRTRTRTRDEHDLRRKVPVHGRAAGRASGFTLLELLIAVAAFAIVLAAINTVYYAAIRLRNGTTNALEAALPIEQTTAILRRDLANIVLPGGTLHGSFQSTSTSNTVAGQASPNFYTATGPLDETSPWAEVQRVSYVLQASTNGSGGRDLLRSVSRNLLPALTDQPERQWLMSGVQSIQFSYHDGTQWRETWDSTTADPVTGVSNTVPKAIKVQIQLASDPEAVRGARVRAAPIELVVPIAVEPRTNTTPRTTPTTGGGA